MNASASANARRGLRQNSIKINDGVRDVQRTTRSGPDGADAPSSLEVFPQTPFPKTFIPIPPSPPKGGSSPTPKAALEEVLDAERATAVIEHRQRIRRPLTAHAAKLLAEKLGRCPDPNLAADTMVANGWQGVEPEWLINRQKPGAAFTSPSPPRMTQGEAIRKMAREKGIIDDTGNPI